MDVDARKENWMFRAVTRKGTLTLSGDKKTAHVGWDLSSDRDIMSYVLCELYCCSCYGFSCMQVFRGFSYKGRGMELSDLTEYNGHILSPDDKTGILFEIKNDKVLRSLTESDRSTYDSALGIALDNPQFWTWKHYKRYEDRVADYQRNVPLRWWAWGGEFCRN